MDQKITKNDLFKINSLCYEEIIRKHKHYAITQYLFHISMIERTIYFLVFFFHFHSRVAKKVYIIRENLSVLI